MNIKVTKCSYAHPEGKLLGHVVNDARVKVYEDNIGDILEAPGPRNITDPTSFLGLSIYYHRFTRNLE